MKRIIYRVVRCWPFWFFLIISLIFPIVFAANYNYRSDSSEYKWDAYVQKYENLNDIAKQIDSLKNMLQQIEYDEDYVEEINEAKEQIDKSICILNYLKEKKYSYDEISQGDISLEMTKDRRSFSQTYITFYIILMLILMMMIVWLVIISPHTNGIYVMENIFFKRKQIFKTEVLAIVVLSGTILLVQLISFLGMRMVFPKKGQYLLFFYNGNIKVITQNMEMVHMLLSSFLIIMLFLSIFILIAHCFTNYFAYILVSLFVIAVYIGLMVYGDSSIFKIFGMLCPANLSIGCSMVSYYVIAILRTGIVILNYWISNRIAMQKSLKMNVV